MFWNSLLILVAKDRDPLRLHWGISQVPLQARSDYRVSPVCVLGRLVRGFSTALQRVACFPVPVKRAASGHVVCVTFGYWFLACLIFCFLAYLTFNPIVLVKSSR